MWQLKEPVTYKHIFIHNVLLSTIILKKKKIKELWTCQELKCKREKNRGNSINIYIYTVFEVIYCFKSIPVMCLKCSIGALRAGAKFVRTLSWKCEFLPWKKCCLLRRKKSSLNSVNLKHVATKAKAVSTNCFCCESIGLDGWRFLSFLLKCGELWLFFCKEYKLMPFSGHWDTKMLCVMEETRRHVYFL